MIKNIIFDFGDIFINLDKPATREGLAQFGLTAFDRDMEEVNQRYEKGFLSSAKFTDYYCSRYPQLNSVKFKNIWNAVLCDFPRYRLSFLQKLRESRRYNLFLLSNTNEIHIEWVKEHVPFYEDFKSCFDGFYLSYEISLRKPEQQVYRFVLESHGLNPRETLFIDDTPENTDAAEKLGIRTWTLKPGTDEVTELEFHQKLLL